MNYEIVAKNIRRELKNYIIKHNLKSLVLGISGGVDSMCVAALAKPVCDELGIPLIGRWIFISSNAPEEHERANAVGRAFCTDYKQYELTNIYSSIRVAFETIEGKEDISVDDGDKVCKIRNGNLKARLRMMALYNIAQLHRGMVLSTDNFTELMLSFFTLHGDVGDYGMIQNLWKIEVYELSKWIALNECGGTGSECRNAILSCVEATPTDGLGITNSDLDQLGVDSYGEVDVILKRYLSTGEYDDGCLIINRHIRTAFKRNNPFNLPRELILKNAV